MNINDVKFQFNCKHITGQNIFDYNANKSEAHYHNHYELFYFLGDQMNYFVNNRTLRLSKHDIVLIPPHIYHRSTYFENTNQERVLISFSADFFSAFSINQFHEKLAETFSHNLIRTEDANIRARISNIVNYILDAYSENRDTGTDRVRLLLGELLLYINGILHIVTKDTAKNLLTASDKHIYEIVNFINKEYTNKITLDEISERFFISKYYLCRMFKEVMGMSIIEFINAKRISETAFLLQNTDKSISEIAIASGFNSHAFFIKLFKKTFGITPRQYRKSNK